MKQHPLIKWLIKDPVVLSIIFVNTLTLFLAGFPSINNTTKTILHWIDYSCLIYFLIEALLKIWILGFSKYWKNGWNKIDFLIVVGSLPFLTSPFVNNDLAIFSFLPLLRMGRFLRFWRMMRFIPNTAQIVRGVLRALKVSVGVFLVLFGLNIILAMGANILFGELAPKYFGNPLISFYSMFKVLTVEGWFEIPDTLADEGLSGISLVVLRLYFSIAVLIGGILGFSIADAVFVDEMVADNNDHLEEMITELREELQQIHRTQKEQWSAIQSIAENIQKK